MSSLFDDEAATDSANKGKVRFFYSHTTYSISYSVSPSVRRLVGPSVRPSVTQWEIKPKSDLTSITAPAHPYATDAVVYTAFVSSFSF